MLVICNGMPRSASTWSFNVARALIASTGHDLHCAYEENLYRFFSSAPLHARDLLLKCHSLDAMGLTLVRSDAAKLIFTWRDPIDATASFMAMFEPDFERTLPIMRMSLDLLARHQAHGRGLLIGYDQITSDGAAAVARIASYLCISADEQQVAAIAEEFGLGKMRRKVEEIGDLDYGPNLVRHEYGLYDPVTLLNVDHIRSGDTGYGRKTLTPAQIRRIDELARDCGCVLPAD